MKLLFAGLVLAFSAQAASIQTIPDWEGHPGSLTITIWSTTIVGQGSILEQYNYNFIVGPQIEIPDAVAGSMLIDIANTTVFMRAYKTHIAPSTEFQFTLNGPEPEWFNYHHNWFSNTALDPNAMVLYKAHILTPEPSTYALMGAGLGLLALLRRRLTAR